jgi:hypothetical protein
MEHPNHIPEPAFQTLVRWQAAIKLRSWTEGGIYAKLFDQPTTMRLNSNWLFFNVEGLSSDPRLETAMSMLIATAIPRAISQVSLAYRTIRPASRQL